MTFLTIFLINLLSILAYVEVKHLLKKRFRKPSMWNYTDDTRQRVKGRK